MNRLLLRAAEKSQHGKSRHSAIVIRAGRVLSTRTNGPELHAEVRAVNAVKPELRNRLTLWSGRIMADGTLGNAMPCPECLAYLHENGVKKVYYSDEEGNILLMHPGP